MKDKIKDIARLNDSLRKKIGTGFADLGHDQVVSTRGVSMLPYINAIYIAVRDFEIDYGFTENNDPYGEHDFGAFTINHIKFFWKIDYYDLEQKYASPDPTNPEVTSRVLTIMKAEEY